MDRLQLLNEEIINILFKYVIGEPLTTADQTILNRWLFLSSYNRSVFDDINTDPKLRKELIDVYSADRSQFWNVIISYRTTLHPDMPPRIGNFWQRAIRSISGLFRRKKPRN